MVSDASPIAVNAIQNISAQKSQRIYYTLSGTPVLNPEAPGLYFCEGKKFRLYSFCPWIAHTKTVSQISSCNGTLFKIIV